MPSSSTWSLAWSLNTQDTATGQRSTAAQLISLRFAHATNALSSLKKRRWELQWNARKNWLCTKRSLTKKRKAANSSQFLARKTTSGRSGRQVRSRFSPSKSQTKKVSSPSPSSNTQQTRWQGACAWLRRSMHWPLKSKSEKVSRMSGSTARAMRKTIQRK